MKYRVQQVNNVFYPQYRNFLGFWCNFGMGSNTVWYSSLFNAMTFIEEIDKKESPKIVIHPYK